MYLIDCIKNIEEDGSNFEEIEYRDRTIIVGRLAPIFDCVVDPDQFLDVVAKSVFGIDRY